MPICQCANGNTNCYYQNWHIALLAHWQIISLDFRSVFATFSVLFFRAGERIQAVVTGFGDQLTQHGAGGEDNTGLLKQHRIVILQGG